MKFVFPRKQDISFALSQPVLAFAFFAFVGLMMEGSHLLRVVEDWDESTFIVMGADILRGHLPYIQLWDVKPPLLYALFALLIVIGKTIAGIRATAIVYMALAGLGLYLMLRARKAPFAGIVAGAALIIYSFSIMPSILAEHMLCLPLALLILICGRGHLTAKDAMLAGVLIALTGLIRTNMLLLLPFLCLALLLESAGWRMKLTTMVMAGVGALLPILVMLLIYGPHWWPLLWATLMQAPYYYAISAGPVNWPANFMRQMSNNAFVPLYAALWVLGGVGIVVGLRTERRIMLRLTLLFIATMISIYLTGRDFEHYLIQAFPFLCIFAARFATANRLAAVLLVPALLAYPAYKRGQEYRYIEVIVTGQKNDVLYQAAAYMNHTPLQDEYIYACNTQILYFMTGAKVPYYLLHPGAGDIPFFATGLLPHNPEARHDIWHLMEQKPMFLVYNQGDMTCMKPSPDDLYDPPVMFGTLAVRKRHEFSLDKPAD